VPQTRTAGDDVIPCRTSDAVSQRGMMVRCHEGSGKVKERKRTCIAPIVSITRPLSAQMWITQSYLQIHHICLSGKSGRTDETEFAPEPV